MFGLNFYKSLSCIFALSALGQVIAILIQIWKRGYVTNGGGTLGLIAFYIFLALGLWILGKIDEVNDVNKAIARLVASTATRQSLPRKRPANTLATRLPTPSIRKVAGQRKLPTRATSNH